MSEVRSAQAFWHGASRPLATKRPRSPSTHPFRSDDRQSPGPLPEGRMSDVRRCRGARLPRGGRRGLAWGRAHGLGLGPGVGACSSVGQSARLISVRSAVQIGPGPPFRGQRSEVRWCLATDRGAVWPRLQGVFCRLASVSSEWRSEDRCRKRTRPVRDPLVI